MIDSYDLCRRRSVAAQTRSERKENKAVEAEAIPFCISGVKVTNGAEEVIGGSGLTKRGEEWLSPRTRKRIKRAYSSREIVQIKRKRELPSLRIPMVRMSS